MKRKAYSGFSPNRHTAASQRAMSIRKAGGYDVDRREPESMDIPEICSFNTDGILINLFPCSGEIVVVYDTRFGVIPVCISHKRLVIKRGTQNAEIEITESEFSFRYYPASVGEPGFYYPPDASPGNPLDGGDEWDD